MTEQGIRTNVTLIFSSAQALLAAAAGATYVSPFVGRLDDIGYCGTELIREIVEIFRVQKIKTEIIAASVRSPLHVAEIARTGCDIATVPYKVFEAMTRHPLTDSGITRFLSDWDSVKDKQK